MTHEVPSAGGPGATPPEAHSGSEDRISVLDLMNVLLRHSAYIIILPVAVGLLFGILRLSQPRAYEASAAFLPQGRDVNRSPVAGLASQFGITVPGQASGEGPEFYAQLLQSRPLLESALTSRYSYVQDGERVAGTLLEIYGIEGDRVGRHRAIERLRSSLTVDPALRTGLVTLQVRASAPELAESIAARLVELLNAFNMRTRQSHAANEERFVEERLREAHAELRAAEGELEEFLRSNRSFQASPELSFEHERRQRQVSLREELYSTLAQARERARLDAIRNTPVLTIVEYPENSAAPVGRGTILWTIIGALVGLVLAVVLAFVLDFVRATQDTDRPDAREFNRLRERLWATLAAPLAGLQRRARNRNF